MKLTLLIFEFTKEITFTEVVNLLIKLLKVYNNIGQKGNFVGMSTSIQIHKEVFFSWLGVIYTICSISRTFYTCGKFLYNTVVSGQGPSILGSILTGITKRILMYLQICHWIQKQIALYERFYKNFIICFNFWMCFFGVIMFQGHWSYSFALERLQCCIWVQDVLEGSLKFVYYCAADFAFKKEMFFGYW